MARDKLRDPPQRIAIPDGELLLYPQFFAREVADTLLRELTEQISWKQERIKVYGKEHDVPRLTAWYGDANKRYSYSGITVEAAPWTEPLLQIKQKIEGVSEQTFNSVLLNLYRNGADSVAWHSDDEPEMGPVIASVSFGEQRPFQLRHKKNSFLKKAIGLPHGSLLMMGGTTQQYWMHQLPKSSRNLQPRINLTFRTVR